MNQNLPLISIITATYNTTELIFETLKKLENQTYKNFEWIVVDDGSKNKDILNELKKTTSLSIRLILSETNQGPSSCRNIGVKHSSGEYLMFLDDDDYYSENYIENVTKEILNDPEIVTFTSTNKFFIEDNKQNIISPKETLYKEFNGTEILDICLNSNFICHSSLTIKKSYFIDINGYDTDLYADEDGNLMFKLFLKNYKFKYIENTFHMYRQHNLRNRLSHNENDEKILNRLLAMDKLINLFKDNSLLEKYSLELALRLDHLALSACSNKNKILTKKILSKANEIYPNYLKKSKSLKIKIRSIVGCYYYDKIIQIYSLMLKLGSKLK